MKKSVIIIASLGMCFILGLLFFVLFTNMKNSNDSNKKDISVEIEDNKALQVITSRTGEDAKNYEFQEKDLDGHYIFKTADGVTYTVDLEKDSYVVSESHSFKGAGE